MAHSQGRKFFLKAESSLQSIPHYLLKQKQQQKIFSYFFPGKVYNDLETSEQGHPSGAVFLEGLKSK